MSIKVINFDLNFIPTGVPPIVHIHQYDLGEIVTLRPTLYYRDELYNGMNLEECDFIVAYQRPDGSQQSYTIENHVFLDEYVFEFPLDANMTAMHGPNVMSLGFADSTTSNVLWTQNFILYIERHPIQADDYIGSSAYDGMIRLLKRYTDEAYDATPPGYEEHIAKLREAEAAIDELKETIEDNLEEAKTYTEEQMAGLGSIYATLQDVTNAANEGRAYAGTLIGDTETRILNDMSLSYQLKSDAENDKTDLQIYAEQVSTASATELKDYLGIDYTSSEPGLTTTGLLNTTITQTASELVSNATANFVTQTAAGTMISDQVDSTISQAADRIKIGVIQNYEVMTPDEKLKAAVQSYTNSTVTVESSKVETRVSAYLDDSIANLKIGAQNLLRGTNEYRTQKIDIIDGESVIDANWVPVYNNGGWECTGTLVVGPVTDNPGNGFTLGATVNDGLLSQNQIGFLVNKGSYVVHLYLKGADLPDPHDDKEDVDEFISNIIYLRNSATGNKISLELTTSTDSETHQEVVLKNQSFNFHNPFKEVVTYPIITYEDENGETVTKVKKQVDHVEIVDSDWKELEWYFTCNSWPENVDIVIDSTDMVLHVCGIKMEEGSKHTAWQPNEYDIKRYTDTQITQTNESIRLIASAQETMGEDFATMSGQLEVQAGAITQLVSGGYLTQNGTGDGYSVTTSETLVNMAKTAVSTAYHINENTVQGLQNAIGVDDLGITLSSSRKQIIGVENLIKATDLFKTAPVPNIEATWALADEEHGWGQSGTGSGTIERIELTANNRPFNNVTRAWRITADSSLASGSTQVHQYDVPVSYQKDYVLSCYARCTTGSGKVKLQTYYSSSQKHVLELNINATDNADWTLFQMPFNHDFESSKNVTRVYFGLTHTSGTACTIEICAMKLERGIVPTTWCPSVFDVEAYMSSYIKVQNGLIESRVEGIETWKNNIKIGSQNLLKGTNEFTFVNSLVGNDTYDASDGKWTGNSRLTENLREIIDITNPPAAGFTKSIKITGANTTQTTLFGQYVNPASKIYSEGMTYSLSGWFRVHPDSTEDTVAVYIQNVGIPVGETSVDNIATFSDYNLKKSDGWKYIRLTYCPTDADTTVAKKVFDLTKRTIFWFGVYASTGTVEFAGLKLEEGVTPTSYSLNPYDTEYKVDKITVAYTDFMQTDEYIKLVAGDYDNGDKVIMAINGATGTATIAGEKVHIEGNTTFTNMQSAVQNAVSGSVKRIYYRTTTDSQPSAPSSGVTTGVTSTATTAGGWRTVIPTFSPGDTFYWTCEEYKKNDGKFYYTNVSPFHATTIDGANIYAGSITLTSFDSTTQNTINTASSDASTAKSDAATAKTTAENAVTRYGQCSTAAGTAAKAVTLTTGKLGTLAAGAVVSVYFTNANTAATPTLNVNSTGAKQIRMVHGTAWETGSNWKAGAVLTFTYDGTYWIVTNGSQTKDAYDKANTAATNASNALTKANAAIVESVTVYYCWDHIQPTQPTNTEITETSSAVDQWTLRMPDPVYNGYYYECTQQKLSDGTFTFTEMRRMSFTEGIAKWISTNDATKIDGGHIYTKSVDTGALNLYGLLQINQSSDGTVGGYIGYESGVTINSGGYSKTNGFRLYSSNKSHYIHTSTDGMVIHANTYLQLYNGGSQYTHMYTNTGMDFRTINDSTGDPQLISSSNDGTTRKPLTIGASYLYLDADTNIIYIQDHQEVDANAGQAGLGYSSTSATGSRFVTYVISTSPDTGDLQFGCGARRARFVGPQTDPSDIRLKKDIDYDGVPDHIDELNVCSFVYKDDAMERTQYGLVAQDVLKIDQNLVDYVADPLFSGENGEVLEEDENGNGFNYYLTLNYSRFIPMLIQKCQKLQKQIDELKGESS